MAERSRSAAGQALLSGSVASLLSTLALVVCSKIERDSAAAGLNGPSQWIWGRWRARTREASLRHTSVGYCIHHLAAIGWASLYETIMARRAVRTLGSHTAYGLSVAALAYVVDYHVAPKRLRQGSKKHLSGQSICSVYAAFGLGMVLTPSLLRRRNP